VNIADRKHLLFAYQAILYHAQDLLMKSMTSIIIYISVGIVLMIVFMIVFNY
jgi:cellobiose-specific phosphotransferase system component IIA